MFMSNLGFRIFSKINRPSAELVKKFENVPVANLDDCMGRIAAVDSGIKSINGVKMVGVAFTVKAPAGDNLMLHKALDMAQKGDIIVVQSDGVIDRALAGEIMMKYAITKGIKGFVLDGLIRDVEAAQELDFGVYARGVSPNGPYKNGPGEINVPVSVGGQIINPGDILCCDLDGIVAFREAEAEALYEKVEAVHKTEATFMEQIAKGEWDRAWVDQTLTDKQCEVIGASYDEYRRAKVK